jgi:putative FmdB family regulatory protein
MVPYKPHNWLASVPSGLYVGGEVPSGWDLLTFCLIAEVTTMPIYEYKCPQCGHQFEKIVRGEDQPACPSCQHAAPERLLSVPGISTQKSRSYTHGIARTKAKAIKKEQDHAQREYERNYIKDHS